MTWEEEEGGVSICKAHVHTHTHTHTHTCTCTHPLHWGAVTALFPCLSRPGGVRSPWLYQPWTPQHLWWFLASLPTHLSAVLSLSSLGHTYLGAIHFLRRFRQTHPYTVMFILGRVATCKYVLWCTPFHDHPQKKAPEKLSLPFPWTSANWAPVGEWSLLRTKLVLCFSGVRARNCMGSRS